MLSIHLALYIFVAVLMSLVLISFVCLILVFRCKKKKANRDSHWIRSVSIEHLRFSPRELEEQRVRTSSPLYAEQRVRTSSPLYANLTTYQDFTVQSQKGSSIAQALRETPLNPALLPQNNAVRYAFRTFTPEVNEPKFVYWETCL